MTVQFDDSAPGFWYKNHYVIGRLGVLIWLTRGERCVWMKPKLAEWACEHGLITKIGLSDGYGGETIPMVLKF